MLKPTQKPVRWEGQKHSEKHHPPQPSRIKICRPHEACHLKKYLLLLGDKKTTLCCRERATACRHTRLRDSRRYHRTNDEPEIPSCAAVFMSAERSDLGTLTKQLLAYRPSKRYSCKMTNQTSRSRAVLPTACQQKGAIKRTSTKRRLARSRLRIKSAIEVSRPIKLAPSGSSVSFLLQQFPYEHFFSTKTFSKQFLFFELASWPEHAIIAWGSQSVPEGIAALPLTLSYNESYHIWASVSQT